MIRFDRFDVNDYDLLRKSVVYYFAVLQKKCPDIFALEQLRLITFRKIKLDSLLLFINHG
jgi:hypothetical protein